jgi:hypothetical protein
LNLLSTKFQKPKEELPVMPTDGHPSELYAPLPERKLPVQLSAQLQPPVTTPGVATLSNPSSVSPISSPTLSQGLNKLTSSGNVPNPDR